MDWQHTAAPLAKMDLNPSQSAMGYDERVLAISQMLTDLHAQAAQGNIASAWALELVLAIVENNAPTVHFLDANHKVKCNSKGNLTMRVVQNGNWSYDPSSVTCKRCRKKLNAEMAD